MASSKAEEMAARADAEMRELEDEVDEELAEAAEAPGKTLLPAAVETDGPSRRTQMMAFMALVVVQMGHTLFFRMSQSHGKYEYNTCSAIATSELFKCLMSLFLFIRKDGGNIARAVHVFLSPQVAPIWIFLAFLYAANNQLTFWMLLYLGPGQLSLGKSTAPMIAAIFLWGFYNERINTGQWLSVAMTVCGLVSVLDPKRLTAGGGSKFGLVLLTFACVKTGFTSVVNAKLLQKGEHSINVLNVVLYGYGFLFCMVFYALGLAPGKAGEMGYFYGYGQPRVLAVIIVQSVIGIVVSYVLKYGGAIVKTLAAAVQAAVLATLDSMVFGIPWSITSVAGTIIVLSSTYNYFFVALRLRQFEEPPESNLPLSVRLGLITAALVGVCMCALS